MRWSLTTTAVVFVGIAVPFLVKLPFFHEQDSRLIHQYLELDLAGFAFFGLFHLVAVIPAALSTMLFWRKGLWILCVAPAYAFVSNGHATLDLASDAQASFGLVFIPIYAIAFYIGGGVVAALATCLLYRPKRPEYP